MDHKHIRRDSTCPLCVRDKDVGLLVCWHCYRRMNLRNGMIYAVAVVIDRREQELRERCQ